VRGTDSPARRADVRTESTGRDAQPREPVESGRQAAHGADPDGAALGLPRGGGIVPGVRWARARRVHAVHRMRDGGELRRLQLPWRLQPRGFVRLRPWLGYLPMLGQVQHLYNLVKLRRE
jgi:hypothetical protein